MIRPAASLIAVVAMIVSTSLVADDGLYQGRIDRQTHPVDHHDDDHGHHDDYDWDHDWERPVHTPNLSRLDQYSDRLEKIAEHLHEDAHKLSQDYQHSASIENYVEQLEHLQKHMHGILHQVSKSGQRAASAVQHIKGDVNKSKNLMNRLYGELKHQGFDGARTNDFRAMAHMREIIVRDAFPLVRAMESELYGYQQQAPVQQYRVNRRVARPAPTYNRPTYNRPRSNRRLPSFRINF
jgi:hypothetical protein